MKLFEAAKQANILEVAKRLGYVLHKHKGNSYRVLCPVHADTDPSCVIHGPDYPNKFANRVHCYSCGFDGSVVDFYAATKGVTEIEAAKELAAPYNPSRETQAPKVEVRSRNTIPAGEYADMYAAFIAWCKAHQATDQKRAVFKYLQGRGLTSQEISKAALAAVPNDAAASAWLSSTYGREAINAGLLNTSGRYAFSGYPLIFSHLSPSGKYMALTGRRIDGDTRRYKGLAGIEKYPYGAHTLSLSGPVYLGEGQLDAIALNIDGKAPSLALGGIAFPPSAFDLLKDRMGVLVLDNDEAGKRKVKEMLTKLKEGGVNVREGELPEVYKDPAEMLTDRQAGKLEQMKVANPALSSLISKARLRIEE